jgi:hypothetical protein
VSWPKCPTCRQEMGVAKIGAPVQTFHLCASCGIKKRVDPPEVEDVLLPLLDLDGES